MVHCSITGFFQVFPVFLDQFIWHSKGRRHLDQNFYPLDLGRSPVMVKALMVILHRNLESPCLRGPNPFLRNQTVAL